MRVLYEWTRVQVLSTSCYEYWVHPSISNCLLEYNEYECRTTSAPTLVNSSALSWLCYKMTSVGFIWSIKFSEKWPYNPSVFNLEAKHKTQTSPNEGVHPYHYTLNYYMNPSLIWCYHLPYSWFRVAVITAVLGIGWKKKSVTFP